MNHISVEILVQVKSRYPVWMKKKNNLSGLDSTVGAGEFDKIPNSKILGWITVSTEQCVFTSENSQSSSVIAFSKRRTPVLVS